MYKKLLILTSFVLVFGLVSSAIAQPTGEILFEYWYNIGGGTVADLTGQAAYPDNPDDGNCGPRSRARSTGPTTTAQRLAVICTLPRTVITRSGFQVTMVALYI